MKDPQLPFFYFIPDYTLFDGVEMAPCQIIKSDYGEDVERIEDLKDYDKIAFWSVYMHFKNGGVDCVADFKTEAEAEDLYLLLERQLEIFQAHTEATT